MWLIDDVVYLMSSYKGIKADYNLYGIYFSNFSVLTFLMAFQYKLNVIQLTQISMENSIRKKKHSYDLCWQVC
jgi:hypothetical protein